MADTYEKILSIALKIEEKDTYTKKEPGGMSCNPVFVYLTLGKHK